MRRALGTIALLLALLACGEDDTATSPPASTPELVSGTAAGGEVSTSPTVLDDDAAVRQYVDRFRGDAFRSELQAAVHRADPPDGWQVAASVVAVGCREPATAEVSGSGDDLTVRAVYDGASPSGECFAPVTTVALVQVPD